MDVTYRYFVSNAWVGARTADTKVKRGSTGRSLNVCFVNTTRTTGRNRLTSTASHEVPSFWFESLFILRDTTGRCRWKTCMFSSLYHVHSINRVGVVQYRDDVSVVAFIVVLQGTLLDASCPPK